MEDVVRQCLKDLQLRQASLVACSEHELNDIIAIALNRLPPRYVATSKGEVLAKTQLRSQVESDVFRELSYAADKVLSSAGESDLRDAGESEA
jgi:competence protein ComFB